MINGNVEVRWVWGSCLGGWSYLVDWADIMRKGLTAETLEGKKISSGDRVLIRICCGRTILLMLGSVLVKIVT